MVHRGLGEPVQNAEIRRYSHCRSIADSSRLRGHHRDASHHSRWIEFAKGIPAGTWLTFQRIAVEMVCWVAPCDSNTAPEIGLMRVHALVLLGAFSCAPPAGAGKVEAILDVPYGEDELQRLDVYLPKEATSPARHPAVLWIHGGGWTEGDKRLGPNSISVLSGLLVERGFVAFACNYRLRPKHLHPAQVDDVQRAVRWIRANADKYQVDPDRIGAVGISAGGHLACMLAVRDTRASQNDRLDAYSSRVRVAVSLNGPTDLRASAESTPILTDVVQRLTEGDPQRIADASPIVFVDSNSAPILFIIGEKDPLIPNSHATRMAEQMRQKGVAAEVLVLPGAGHAIFPSITPRARDALVDFFDRHLKP
jgi:acetyl esterase/lipase